MDAAIDAAPIASPTNPACNAIFQQGQQAMSAGNHAAALAHYEQAFACEPTPFYAQYAFIEACAAGSAAKAKQYYVNLTPAQQTKFAQICIRQKPPVAYQ